MISGKLPILYRLAATVALVVSGLSPLGAVFADTVAVQFKGLDEPLKTNAQQIVSLTDDSDDSEEPRSRDQIRRLFRLVPDEIETALQPYGYFNPEIKSELKQPEENGEHWRAIFRVEPGPATKIEALKLGVTGPGQKQPAIRSALQDTKLKRGERLIQSRYKTTKQALTAAARHAGYLNARFSKSAIRIHRDTNRADVDLVLATGPRYYFGSVAFHQAVLADSFAERFVPFKSGEPFSNDQLVQLQLKLAKTDYYQTIDVTAQRDSPEFRPIIEPWFYRLIFGHEPPQSAMGQLRVPVDVRAEPSPPVHYRISGGYGTDTGPRLGFGVDLRHINRYGHTFQVDLQLSQIKQRLHAAYDIPIRNVNTDKISFTGDIANEDFGDLTTFRYGIGAVRDVGWRYGRRRASLHFLRSRYDLHDGTGTRTENLLYPKYSLSLKRANKSLNPTRGISASVDVRGGSSAVVSATDFLRGDAQATAIVPLADRLDGVVRGQFGAMSVSDFAKLPPSQRFYAGGEGSVRGYGYQSISPTNGDRVDVGGQFLATASVEADYWVYGNFGMATFFDIGDAANSLDFDFKRGVGVGFRWASPVGMVAIDLTHPLDDSMPVSLGVSIGPRL